MPRNSNIQAAGEGWDAAAANAAPATSPYRPPQAEWGDWKGGYRDFFSDAVAAANDRLVSVDDAIALIDDV